MEEGEEEKVYTLSELADSYVDSDIETMDEWLVNMSDEELAVHYRVCNKLPDERTGGEDYEIVKYALILYCRELGLNELAITNELLMKISGFFCVNIIVESLRRKGLATTKGPLFLYKETEITLTEEGEKLGDEIIEDDEKNNKNEE